ncbi:IS3 family transposase [Allohahella sp. A8]|uniref:IS3 family transposase n=1 Tax=Allohahella sp. A8 TaxID=3141461 RepID=UPI003A809660
MSKRSAFRLAGISRTGFYYKAKVENNEALLKARLKALATQRPDFGYVRLHNILKAEGLVTNKKRTYRLYIEEGLQVHARRRQGSR